MTFEGHTEQVNCISFSADGKFLISGSKDKTVRAKSIEELNLVNMLLIQNTAINSVAISLDCTCLAATGNKQFIWLQSYEP